MTSRLAIALPLLCLCAGLPAAANADPGMPAPSVSTMSVVGTIRGPDGGWDFTSVDATARRLYIAHGDAVTAVDLDGLTVTPKLVEGSHVHAVLPLADGRVLSTNGGNDTATLFDGATGKVIATIPTGKNPDAAVYDPASGLVLVMDAGDGNAMLIDPKVGTSPGRIEIGGKLESAVADGKGRVYVNIEDKGEIAIVDTADRKTVGRYALPACEEPSGLAIDTATGLLVTACSNGKAVALHMKDGSVVAELPIPKSPDNAIFDPAHKLFFIPCGEGSLAVIGENDGKASVVATIPTAAGARTSALDSKTGRLYLPTADFAPLVPGEKHRRPLPGTFRVLIVGTK